MSAGPLSVIRLDQFRLLRLILSANGPRFGADMETRAFCVASHETIRDWFHYRVPPADIEALERNWTEKITETGMLSGPMGNRARPFVAIFFLPDFANPANETYAAMFQVRRTLDHRILCLHVPSLKATAGTSDGLYRMLECRLMLQVIVPMVRARRAAAAEPDVFIDRKIDVSLRLGDVDTPEDRSGFILSDVSGAQTTVTSIIGTADNIMRSTARSNGNDASAVLYMLFDYIASLRTRTVAMASQTAPREDLPSDWVFGPIAYYLVVAGRPQTRLFLEENQQADAALIHRLMTEPHCPHLLLCPINRESGHWTLLYRTPGNGTIPRLFDSLGPSTLQQSKHYRFARQLGGDRVTIVEIPASQTQRGLTCGLYVSAVACFLGHDPDLAVPVNELRQVVEHYHSTFDSVWSLRNPRQLDAIALQYLVPAVDSLFVEDSTTTLLHT